MAIIEQHIKTRYGVELISLLRCDQCNEVSTQTAAIGWIQVQELGPRIETMAGDEDASGHYCSKQCLVELYSEQGITKQMAAEPTNLANQENADEIQD